MRFALVLYGGVSLAIYINGVVQEFLHLVRATAPGGTPDESERDALYPDDRLESTERVYRELGQLAGNGGAPAERAADSPILTRFVVDVVSGTSAGGINGIFLAKALAGELGIEQLSNLWVDEADIQRLVNDERSLEGIPGLAAEDPPSSLLNSGRMYWKLLDALDEMDRDRGDGRSTSSGSHLIDELDLWITTTDIRGLPLPIDLMDRVVDEKRHRSVLHFKYGTPYGIGSSKVRDDFKRENNPLLAFAGRATSSFPAAFQPMLLDDIDWTVARDQFEGEYEGRGATCPEWSSFFSDYVDARRSKNPEAPEADFYRSESFGDGGYVDNKPFTWATNALSRRRADHPVDRRLIYIEPDPSEPAPRWQRPPERVGAFSNVRAALIDIPRSETIREDLERLVGRNREIARVREIAARVDQLALDHPSVVYRKADSLDEWLEQSALEMFELGPQYAAYYQLKIAVVLDDLAELVARALGFSTDSDEPSAIRCLIEAWFVDRYREGSRGADQLTQNMFLFRFDTRYRLRRLNYLDARIEQVLRAGFGVQPKLIREQASDQVLAEHRDDIDVALREAKRRLTAIFIELRGDLRAVARDEDVHARLRETGLTEADLRAILSGAAGQAGSIRRAEALIEARNLRQSFSDAADELAARLADPLERAGTALADTVAGTDGALRASLDARQVSQEARAVLRGLLTHLHEYYESYDAILLPLGYGVVDEADPVEVLRISPQDADSVIDERNENRRKLAGIAVRHFGGFFDPVWRKNDILWGRLDAAERIIETVLQRAGDVDRLVRKAQKEIVRDEFSGCHGRYLRRHLPRSVLDVDSASSDPGDVQLTEQQAEAVLDYLRTKYEVPRKLDDAVFDRLLARAAPITEQMLMTAAATRRWYGALIAALAAAVRPALFIWRAKRKTGGLLRRLERRLFRR